MPSDDPTSLHMLHLLTTSTGQSLGLSSLCMGAGNGERHRPKTTHQLQRNSTRFAEATIDVLDTAVFAIPNSAPPVQATLSSVKF